MQTNWSKDTGIYGVLPYVAPEVLVGKNYSQASDICSFGIVMTEILTGYPPYHNIPHNNELAILICQGLRPRINCKIPQLLLDMINRCLDAEPQKRPSAKKLYRILQKCSIDYKDSESEFSQQFGAIKSSKNLADNSTKLIQTHPQAIYSSRLLNYTNLSKPVNATQSESDLLSRSYDKMVNICNKMSNYIRPANDALDDT